MASKSAGDGGSLGGEEEEGKLSMEELVEALPKPPYKRRKVTEEDMERYKSYVDKKWTGVGPKDK